MNEAQHTELVSGRWAEMTLAQQMLNIGSEVSRANHWHKKGNQEQCQRAVFRALELIDLTIEVQRNKHALKEFTRMREVLCDFFLGENEWHCTGEQLQRDFDMFYRAEK